MNKLWMSALVLAGLPVIAHAEETTNIQEAPVFAAPALALSATQDMRGAADFMAMTQPAAVAHAMFDVCLPAHDQERGVDDLLASDTGGDADPETLSRLSAVPMPGPVQKLQTAEGPVLIGSVEGQPSNCQIMFATPFGDTARAHLSQEMALHASNYKLTDDSGAPDQDGVSWQRYSSEAGTIIDIVSYTGRGGQAPSTIYLTVQ